MGEKVPGIYINFNAFTHEHTLTHALRRREKEGEGERVISCGSYERHEKKTYSSMVEHIERIWTTDKYADVCMHVFRLFAVCRFSSNFHSLILFFANCVDGLADAEIPPLHFFVFTVELNIIYSFMLYRVCGIIFMLCYSYYMATDSSKPHSNSECIFFLYKKPSHNEL